MSQQVGKQCATTGQTSFIFALRGRIWGLCQAPPWSNRLHRCLAALHMDSLIWPFWKWHVSHSVGKEIMHRYINGAAGLARLGPTDRADSSELHSPSAVSKWTGWDLNMNDPIIPTRELRLAWHPYGPLGHHSLGTEMVTAIWNQPVRSDISGLSIMWNMPDSIHIPPAHFSRK